MKHHLLSLAAVVIPALLGSEVVRAAPVSGAPPIQVQPPPAKKVNRTTELTAQNVVGVPGETKTFEASLKAGEQPVAGKSVVFEIEWRRSADGRNWKEVYGSAKTDMNGKASAPIVLPGLNQGTYVVYASFAGDDDARASKAQASLSMLKAVSKVELGDMTWGFVAGSPGGTRPSITVLVTRTSDGMSVTNGKDSTITINGQSQPLSSAAPYRKPGVDTYVVLLPIAEQWIVNVQFDGNGSSTPSAAMRTYTKPK